MNTIEYTEKYRDVEIQVVRYARYCWIEFVMVGINNLGSRTGERYTKKLYKLPDARSSIREHKIGKWSMFEQYKTNRCRVK